MRRIKISVVVGLLLVLAGCAGRGGRWEESFDEAGKWDTHSDASAQVNIADGQLRIAVKTANQLAWASAERTYSNFELAVEATQLDGPDDNAYGILIRMEGDKRFYAFSISGDGYARVARYDDGAWVLLGGDWRPSSAIHQGQATNQLALTARGSQFVFSVNGEVVLEVSDATLTRGDVGLYAGSFAEPGVVVGFDNLVVAALP